MQHVRSVSSVGVVLAGALAASCTGPEDFRLYPKRPGPFSAIAEIRTTECANAEYYYWVAPKQTSLGGDIELGTATLADSAVLAPHWESTDGDIDAPAAAVAVYTCSTPGRHEITLTLTDDVGCEDVEQTDVLCVE